MKSKQRKSSNDESERGTGRTTALVLHAIANALQHQGQWVEFVDHEPHTCRSAFAHLQGIHSTCMTLNIKMLLDLRGARVFLQSDVNTVRGGHFRADGTWVTL